MPSFMLPAVEGGAVVDEVVVGIHVVRLARPASPQGLLEAAAAAGAEDAPYWAEAWPAARGLALDLVGRHLTGRRVLEVGCGLGLPALVAALEGADVLASDVEPAALRLVEASAARTRPDLGLATLACDLARPAPLVAAGPFDLVLAADLLYAPALADALAAALPPLLGPEGEAVVAYPFPGQADGLRRRLAAAGLATETRSIAAPGRRTCPSTIRLLTVTRP